MKKLSLLLALALPACAGNPDPMMTAEGEARLAERLEGRVAGEPRACLPMRELQGNTPIDEGTILFRGQGDTLWLNRLNSRCAGLRPWHAISTRTVGTDLCENEIVLAYDPASNMARGSCTLGQFVPYRRPR